jgi:hypothetical protein
MQFQKVSSSSGKRYRTNCINPEGDYYFEGDINQYERQAQISLSAHFPVTSEYAYIRVYAEIKQSTRWFKYDRDDLCVNKSQFVPVIFEPPCMFHKIM